MAHDTTTIDRSQDRCSTRRHRSPWWLVVVASLLAPMAPVAADAAAAGTDNEGAAPTLSWAVDPATSEGPDDRRWIELELDPGESVQEHLAVRNLSSVPATFALTGADGYFTDTGRFTMLPATIDSTEAGTWIDMADSISLEAGEMAVVPFTVTVPENATPGDHAAGVAASVQFVDGDGAQDDVRVDSRVGFRVMTRVTGEVNPAVSISGVTTNYETSWNPFEPGSVDVEVVLENTGNTALMLDGEAQVGGRTAELGFVDGAEQVEMLPGTSQVVTATVDGVWPLVRASTTIEVSGTSDDGEANAESSSTTWAIPWPQLLGLLGLILIVLGLRGGRTRQRRRLSRMLEEARAEGRAERSAYPSASADADVDAGSRSGA